MYKYVSWYELQSELHSPFLGQNREKKSAIEAMNRQAEDQGEVGGVEGGRDDRAQGRLDACPWSEDDTRLKGDDAVRNGLR